MQRELNNFRLQSNHGTSAEWSNRPNFIPLLGEIILYTDLRKFKVGDGKTVVGALEFYSSDPTGIIRFSASATGENMTTTWSEGQAYIGFLNDASAPDDPASYTWCQFISSYAPSGWTVDQISKLEQLFGSLVYTNTTAQAVADELIASLRSSGSSSTVTWTLKTLTVAPSSIMVPSGTTTEGIKAYLTSMTGTYESSEGATENRDLTSKLSTAAVTGTMPTAGNTAAMGITYGGKTAYVSVTMQASQATVSSLTVIYDNSTAVKAGTTLSQLNEVVKAVYSDGTQSTALTKDTDYSLSGTLTAGQNNTITVTGLNTYAGLSTTFTVTVAAATVTTESTTATGSVGSTTLNNLTLAVTQPTALSGEPNKIVCEVNYTPTNVNTVGRVVLTKNSEGQWEGDIWRKADQYTEDYIHHFSDGQYATVVTSGNKVTSITLATIYISASLPTYQLKFVVDSADGVPAYNLTITTDSGSSETPTQTPTTLEATYTGSTAVGTVVTASDWSYAVKDQDGATMSLAGTLSQSPASVTLVEGSNSMTLTLTYDGGTLSATKTITGVASGGEDPGTTEKAYTWATITTYAGLLTLPKTGALPLKTTICNSAEELAAATASTLSLADSSKNATVTINGVLYDADGAVSTIDAGGLLNATFARTNGTWACTKYQFQTDGPVYTEVSTETPANITWSTDGITIFAGNRVLNRKEYALKFNTSRAGYHIDYQITVEVS